MAFPPDLDATGGFASDQPDRNAARFQPGTLLLGRFRVVRLLGAGGMGEVYEAEDLELREQIALKTIRLSHARDTSMLDRLRKEVQLGRRVSHPNVCRLFDVFSVTLPATVDAPPVDCAIVTMELLRGRTLADHLRDEGSLPLDQALPLAQQIAEGLQAAHTAGVVHRDLKSANVFLARDGETTRAVITDFGLATTVAGEGANWELSMTGAVIGTLAYMSPEQLRGEPATPLSDIYAFGIVLYEMVSGVLPFRALTPMAAALKRVSERPEDLRRHLPDIAPPWYDAINRCLALEPEKRFASATDAAAALAATPGWWSAPWVRRTATVGAVVAIVAGSAMYVQVLKRTTRPPTTVSGPTGAPVSHARPSVALLGFKNTSGQPEFGYISTALDQGLGSELAVGERARIISGEEVARMKQELAIPAGELASDTLARVRDSLGCDFVVLGSYLATPGSGRLRVEFRVQDTRSGETVQSWSQDGTENDLLNLISESGAVARQKLDLGSAVATADATAKIGLPTSADARRLYAEGLDKLRGFDASVARDLFQRTIDQEPTFALAHVGLSMAWGVLGYDAQAVKAAATATQLSRGLRKEQQVWIEGLYRESTHDWPKAVAAFTQLVQDYPDDPEYVIQLAEAQTSAGQPKDALATIGTVRKHDAAFADAPRLWLAEAGAAEALGDAARQETAARAAIEQARRRGADQLVARASIALGRALQLLGRPAEAAEANETARRLAEKASDRRGVARALIQLGDLSRRSGDLKRAEQELQDALDISRSIGNKRQTMQALNELANVDFDTGRFVQAGRMYQEAVNVSREVGDQNAEARALGNLASVKYEQGDIAEALHLDDRALDLRRSIGDRRSIAFSLSNMAETAADLGKLERAQAMYDESRDIAMQLEDKNELSYALSGLASIALRRDDLPQAQRLLEQAIQLRRDIGEQDGETDARVALAGVLAEGPDRRRAAQLLSGISPQASADSRALAASVRAQLALEEGRAGDARKAIASVRGSGKSDYGLSTGVMLDLMDARVLAAEGRSAAAVALAQGVRDRMRSRQLEAFELEAALVIAEITHDRTAARQLAARARRDGFLLVMRKASAIT
jgi:tetratricopeptide (TPR) repeat protein/tRNA A-37 threonylcarbamoyl transferase component Bud32